MAVAALIVWIITAGGGSVMLGQWLMRGGPRQPRTTHLPPGMVFAHFLVAAAGLVVWIVHLVTGAAALAWAGFVIAALVALVGFALFARWLPVRTGEAPESSFPLPVVGAHGLLGAATLVLTLLTALGVG